MEYMGVARNEGIKLSTDKQILQSCWVCWIVVSNVFHDVVRDVREHVDQFDQVSWWHLQDKSLVD